MVPAPVRAGAARLRLGEPGGRRGVRGHPAVLAGPRRRRLPDRRRQRAEEGPVASPTSGPRTRTPCSRRSRGRTTRSGTATRCTRSTAAGAGSRTTYAGDRMFVAEAWVDNPDRLARYVRPDELHTAFNFDFVRAAWDADELRTTIDGSRAAAGSVGAPDDLGAVQPRRHPARHALRPAGLDRRRRHRRGPGRTRTPRSTPRSACAGPGPPRLLMLALPGSAYVYQGEELGLPEVVDLPEDVLADPIWERSGHTRARPGRLPGADPVDPDGPSLRLRHRRALAAAAGRLGRAVGARRRRASRARPSSSTGRRCGCAGELLHGEDLDVGRRAAPEGAAVPSQRRTTAPRSSAWSNLGSEPVPLPAYDEVLVASGPLDGRRAPGRHRRLAPAVLTRRSVWTGLHPLERVVPERSLNFRDPATTHRLSAVSPSVNAAASVAPGESLMVRLAEFVLRHRCW